MAVGFGDFSKRMDLLAREMGGQASAARLKRVGVLSKTDINAAVRADLGDLSMSGWRRGNPHEVVGRFDILGDSAVMMRPARRGVGPMRVLEQGRQAYSAGDKRRRGSYTSKKTGITTERFKTMKRNGGATQGKGTWSDAVQIMEREMPKRFEHELARDMARFIRGV